MANKIPCGGFFVGDGLEMDGNILKTNESLSVLEEKNVTVGSFLVMGATAPEWQVIPNAKNKNF